MRRPRSLVVTLATLGLGIAGIGVAVAGSGDSSMTITKAGSVVDGREVHGYIHIKADRVTIRNSTVRYGGNGHAIRVFDGFSGTVVDNTSIVCTGSQTNGLVFGNYTAQRVRITGCRHAFLHSASAPATITESTWNGKPVTVGVAPPDAELGPAPTVAPTTTPTATSTATPITSTPSRTASSSVAPRASTDSIPTSFPGSGNTGVPDGTRLVPSGSLTLATDGQVVSGLDIAGCVTVKARNVVIRKSRITCGSTYSVRTIDADNLLVEDVEIDGKGVNSAAVCCGEYTLRRVEIRNVIDGPRLGNNTVVEYSWIHHLIRRTGTHNDTLQTTGATNMVIRGNTLEAYNPNTRDPMNACLEIGSSLGPIVANLVYERNYCNGGNYSISVSTDLNADGIVMRNNVFGRNHRYGVIARPTQSGFSWDRPSNIYQDTQQPVV